MAATHPVFSPRHYAGSDFGFFRANASPFSCFISVSGMPYIIAGMADFILLYLRR